jgi:transposase
MKPTARSRNRPAFDARGEFTRITGVDLVAVTGLGAATVQTILAEVGTDMTRFPSSKQFCSWLGLAPHNDISGGKVLRSRTMKVVNRAGQAFRQAAQSVARSDTVFGIYFRSMRGRLGPQQAIVATAHKLARVFYHMLKYREAFQPESIERYEQHRRARDLKHLMRRATRLGYELRPVASEMEEPLPTPQT